MREFKKATIYDVARRAGVSATTVSLLLKGKRDVCSAETARRIRAAISALGYAPGPAIRGGRERETRTLGVCVGLPHQRDSLRRNVFAEQVWRGILQVADDTGYALTHYPREVRDSADATSFLDGRIDGLILAPAYQDPRPERLARAGLPLVLVGNTAAVGEGCGTAYVLEGDVVDLSLSHLWEQGHRRIAHVAGPVESLVAADATERGEDRPDNSAAVGGDSEGVEELPPLVYVPSEAAIQRRERYIRWMQVRGAFDARLMAEAGGWQIRSEDARALVERWRRMDQPPTAAFCANDGIALVLIAAITASGGHVPDTLSVVGVDDTPAALLSDPPLTSVVLPGEEVGAEATRCLLHRMSGAPAEQCRAGVPVTRLAVRQSTAYALGK
jgi:LacI family transcriptional regulator